MERYSVTGMSCAACSSRVEKAVCRVDGVDSCSVNLLTNSMIVEGSAPADKIIDAVKDAGYGAELKSSRQGIMGAPEGYGNGIKVAESFTEDEFLKDLETPVLKKD